MNNICLVIVSEYIEKCSALFLSNVKYHIAGFFHGWKFSLFNFSWVDILAFGATLHRICIVEEILGELILVL